MSVRTSRRVFLESTGFTAATMMGSSWLDFARAAENKSSPDLIVINAKVTTMDPAMPKAEAFAVLGTRFLAVGSTTDMKSLAGPKTRIYDAKGGMVVPAFADTHNHGGGENLLYGCVVGDPYTCEFTTLAVIFDKLKKTNASLPPGVWLNANFYDDTKVKDNRPITRHDLDAISTERPIAIEHRGGHTSYYNTKAFEMAGITKNTPDPVGGTFDKDAKGELSGYVTTMPALSSQRSAPSRLSAPPRKRAASWPGWSSSPRNTPNRAWSASATTKMCWRRCRSPAPRVRFCTASVSSRPVICWKP